MQTKVILRSIVPVGAPIKPAEGSQPGPARYNAFAATFQADDFPADGVTPPDYAHLHVSIPLTLIVSSETAKALKNGGAYIMSLNAET